MELFLATVAVAIGLLNLWLYRRLRMRVVAQDDDVDFIAKQAQESADRKTGCKSGYPGCPGGCSASCADQINSDTVLRL